ncbi:MAG: class I adenylate-forming enzyme family protein [Stellaceae bacterium]
MTKILSLLSAKQLTANYASGLWRDETIYALANARAALAPDALALRDRTRRLSYRALIASVDAVAQDLHRRGVRAGQRVAIWTSSRIEAAVSILACLRNGYVCCPSLHRDHTIADIVALLERTRAAALFAERRLGADADRHDIFAAARRLPFLRHAYELRRSPALTENPDLFEGLLLPLSRTEPAPPPNSDPNRVAYLAFTSGTTGIPKGVMHSDNTLLAPVRAAIDDWQLDTRTVAYSFSPLSHNLGFGALIAMLVAGGELVLHDLPTSESVVERLREVGATYLVGVPTHAIDLVTELRARGATTLPPVRGFRISGGPLPTAVVSQLREFGVLPQSGYGMTEAGSHHYTLPDDDPERIAQTCGRACRGYEVRIWRQDDPDIEAGTREIGEIGGRGASLMLGYYDDQRATEATFNAQGWFLTGDLGWLDGDGYLHITGRKKDIISRGGHNIHPARIELLALRHAAMARAAAFPIADARLGEKVCLAVVFRDGMMATADDLLRHLDALGLSKYDMPEFFFETGEIPLTASGKMLKRELANWVREGRVRPQPIRWRPQQ